MPTPRRRRPEIFPRRRLPACGRCALDAMEGWAWDLRCKGLSGPARLPSLTPRLPWRVGYLPRPIRARRSSRLRTNGFSPARGCSWVFAHELARPGETLSVTMAGRPILLVCDTPGEVRAFHNVCRHRCLKLVDEPGNVGRAIAALTIPGPTASTMRFAPLPISAVAIRVRHPPASTARSTGWCRCARRSGTTGYS